MQVGLRDRMGSDRTGRRTLLSRPRAPSSCPSPAVPVGRPAASPSRMACPLAEAGGCFFWLLFCSHCRSLLVPCNGNSQQIKSPASCMWHREIWKHHHNTSTAHSKFPRNLTACGTAPSGWLGFHERHRSCQATPRKSGTWPIIPSVIVSHAGKATYLKLLVECLSIIVIPNHVLRSNCKNLGQTSAGQAMSQLQLLMAARS